MLARLGLHTTGRHHRRKAALPLLLLFCLWPLADLVAGERDAGRPPTESPAVESKSDDEIIAFIDEQIRAGWQDAGIRPSEQATDSEWCRRVFLDLLGRIPTVEESTAFLSDRSPHKKAELVDRLLALSEESDQYLEEYARNWSTIWSNLLIGRTGGMDRRSLVNREGMHQYLRRSLLRNKPYDRFVYELVSATGVNTPGEEDYNGAVNFLLDKLDDNAVQATAQTARLFLGQQVQCTQCHNHPFNNYKQDQFWGLNAFFRQTRALRTFEGRDVVSVRLANEDFPGELRDPKNAAIFYELRNGIVQSVYPTFIDGTKINPSGYLDEVNRREELARLIIESEDLDRALVNRMWAHMFGYGFTKPIDDMGPHNPVSHPELLEGLAREFRHGGRDIKRLLRWLALSVPYSLSSRYNDSNETDDPALGARPLFSRFYLRQMRAEELYESLLAATRADQTSRREQDQLKAEWLRQFSIAFGTDENDETTTFNGTIPQVLMMMNGDLIKRATDASPGSFLYEVAMESTSDRAKINQLYMAALSRPPTTQELRWANELWRAREGDTIAALQDIWWALLNSNEFILNH